VLPDRGAVTMDRSFLSAYVNLLIRTCHRRGIHAMGGMAAQIPIKNDPEANEAALEKVRQDKLREVRAGHDGTWVAHPGLVPVAREVFDAHMPTPHQIHVSRETVKVSAADLVEVPRGAVTEEGLRVNVSVGVQYLEAWLQGNGCVPLNHLMEDAATAEISRTQLWQWIRHGAAMADGRRVTAALVRGAMERERERIRQRLGEESYAAGRFDLAFRIFQGLVEAEECEEFLTLKAYPELD